jgi:hypothetical protein
MSRRRRVALVAAAALLGLVALSRRPIATEAYHCFAFDVLAHRLAPETAAPRVVTRAVLRFVHEQLNPEAGPIRDVLPWLQLVRGVGSCDQAALVGAHLLLRRGIEARPLLFTRADGVSPHTALEVQLDGRWTLWDPHFGLEFVDGDRSLELAELSATAALLERQRPWRALRAAEWETVLRFYSGLLRSTGAPRRWPAPGQSRGSRERRLDALARTFSRVAPARDAAVRLWPRLLPGGCGAGGGCADDASDASPAAGLLARARQHELLGDVSTALQLYGDAVAAEPASIHALRARFHRGRLRAVVSPASAAADLDAVRADPRARWLRADAERALGLAPPPSPDPRLAHLLADR